MPMESPGAAFSNAMEEQLMRHETAKRQAMLDTMSVQREADLAKYREDEIGIRRDEMAQHAKAAAEAQALREDAAKEAKDSKAGKKTQATVDSMVKGDIASPDLITAAQQHGIRLPVMAMQPPPLPDTRSMQTGQPIVPQDAPPGIAAPQPQVYQGSKAEQFVDSLPDDDPRKQEIRQALGAEAAGLKVPSGFFAKTPVSKTRFQFDPVTGKYFDPTGKQVTDLPPDAVIDRRAEPKDHSVGDAAHEATASRHLDTVHQTAVTELNKRAVPYESHIQSINDLGIMLNARTPQADALIAPLVLKATVSGAGTGFRMTQSEINQVVGGRSKWESLQAALNTWSSDPSKALTITDEQRTELRSMAKAIRTKAYGMQQKITTTRQALDDASTPQEIHKLMTSLQNDLSAGEMASTDVAASDDVIEYGMDGKPIKPVKQ